jgi:hypothetical protein
MEVCENCGGLLIATSDGLECSECGRIDPQKDESAQTHAANEAVSVSSIASPSSSTTFRGGRLCSCLRSDVRSMSPAILLMMELGQVIDRRFKRWMSRLETLRDRPGNQPDYELSRIGVLSDHVVHRFQSCCL